MPILRKRVFLTSGFLGLILAWELPPVPFCLIVSLLVGFLLLVVSDKEILFPLISASWSLNFYLICLTKPNAWILILVCKNLNYDFNHLLYADDLILVISATRKASRNITLFWIFILPWLARILTLSNLRFSFLIGSTFVLPTVFATFSISREVISLLLT